MKIWNNAEIGKWYTRYSENFQSVFPSHVAFPSLSSLSSLSTLQDRYLSTGACSLFSSCSSFVFPCFDAVTRWSGSALSAFLLSNVVVHPWLGLSGSAISAVGCLVSFVFVAGYASIAALRASGAPSGAPSGPQGRVGCKNIELPMVVAVAFFTSVGAGLLAGLAWTPAALCDAVKGAAVGMVVTFYIFYILQEMQDAASRLFSNEEPQQRLAHFKGKDRHFAL